MEKDVPEEKVREKDIPEEQGREKGILEEKMREKDMQGEDLGSRTRAKGQSVMGRLLGSVTGGLDRGHALLRGHETLLLTLLCLACTLLCVFVTERHMRLEDHVRDLQAEVWKLQGVRGPEVGSRAKRSVGELKSGAALV